MPFPTDILSALPGTLDGQALRTVAVDQTMIAKAVDKLGDLSVNLATAAVILLLTVWAAGWFSKGVKAALGRFHRDDPDVTLQGFFASLARYAVIVVGIVAVLQQLGVKTTSVLAVLGAASLAIGLALQGALSNVAAGVMILLFRPYRVGDLIETGARRGVVRSLDLFFTELATLDNIRIIVPNSKVMADLMLNHSTHSRRRADAVMRLPFASDINAVIDGLRARIEADPRARKDPPPAIDITAMAHDNYELTARVWTSREDEPVLRSELLWCARLLAVDPKAALPPMAKSKARSKAVEPPARGLALLRRHRKPRL